MRPLADTVKTFERKGFGGTLPVPLWVGGSTSSHRLWGGWPRLFALQNSKALIRTDTDRTREVGLSTHVVESNRMIESRQL